MTALFLTSLAIACLVIAAQARPLSSESRKGKIAMIIGCPRTFSPPRSPQKSAPPRKQITKIVTYLGKFPPPDELTTDFERTRRTPFPSQKLSPPESQLQTSGSPCVTGKAKSLSPPPPPAPSKSPTQSENIAENPCSKFVRMRTDYGRPNLSPPTPPEPSKSPSQLENIASPCGTENPCSSFITTVADFGKPKSLPPPPPAPSKSPTQSEQNDSPYVAGNPCSTLITMKSDNGRPKLLPPPPPASSKSPTQSDHNDSPCVDGNSCSGRTFIEMVTDHDL